MKKRWLAIYTKPRWEKKIHLALIERGIENYCPLNKVPKKWADRTKMVEEPLFKSYVFVHIAVEEEKEVRLVNGVLNFVYWLGKPAVIKKVEINRIRKFLNEYDNVQVEQLVLKANDKVLITAGIFMEKQARVIRRMGKRVELEIESLGYKLIAYVEQKNIRMIKDTNH